MSDVLDRLKAVVGPKGVVAGPLAQAPYLQEWRNRWQGKTPLIVRPATAEQVAALVKICAETKTPVTPQGGNTGLVGGQMPTGPEILISLSRMARIRKVDAGDNALIAEAGVTLQAVQAAAAEAGRLFAVSLAADGTASIGGALSSNAGGTNVLRYGMARDQVLGLEVVLPDGRIWHGLKTLRKDNTGYDLKQLFVGAEGTLGLITAAALKLWPAPADQAAAFVAVRSPEAALEVLNRLQAASGQQVTGCELMPRRGLDFVLRHIPDTRDPLAARYEWYVLLDVASGRPGAARPILEDALAEGAEAGLVLDAALAQDESQRADFWHVRDSLSEAQKPEGGSIKHDVSVAPGKMPAFIAKACAAVEAACPGIRPVPFGHLGDGNIHFNLSQPEGADKTSFLKRWEEMNRIVHDIVADMDGSISAEHGLGQLKREEIRRYKSTVEMDLMARIKAALDPDGIMNPGKLL